MISVFQNSSIQGNSHSTESLDDSSMAFGDLDEETEMLMTEEMAEAWSVTVDKRTLKKMTAKDIKRQDHIWGLLFHSLVTIRQYLNTALSRL